MKIEGNSVLITGGASGIGKIMGRMALEKGAKQVVIWDINEKNIETVVAEHNKYGKSIGFKVDVSSNEAVLVAYEKTKSDVATLTY